MVDLFEIYRLLCEFCTYELSTNVMSRFFSSLPVDLAVNACKSPTSRHTPITSAQIKNRNKLIIAKTIAIFNDSIERLKTYQQLRWLPFRRFVKSEWKYIWPLAHPVHLPCTLEWVYHCSSSFRNRLADSKIVCLPASIDTWKCSRLCRSDQRKTARKVNLMLRFFFASRITKTVYTFFCTAKYSSN